MKKLSTNHMSTIQGGAWGGDCNTFNILFGTPLSYYGECADARLYGRLTDFNGYAGHKHDH